METIFISTKNSKANESNKFSYYFTDKLNLSNPNENIALVNLSIYYTWKNIKSTCKNNKFKLSAPTWNDEFNLPDSSYSVSDIQDYFEYVGKKYETVAYNSPIQIYMNKIKNLVLFKIKTDYNQNYCQKKQIKCQKGQKNSLLKIKMLKMYQDQKLQM